MYRSEIDIAKITVEKKRELIKRFCKSKKCTECPLIITAYCQLGDESNRAVNEAFEIYLKRGGKK